MSLWPKSPGARTGLVLAFAALAYAIVESAALGTGERSAWTISRLIWEGTFDLPLIPLCAGILAGHE